MNEFGFNKITILSWRDIGMGTSNVEMDLRFFITNLSIW